LLPGSADVAALRVMFDPAARSTVAPVAFPPMFAAAYRALVNADARDHQLLAPDSLADTIAARLCNGGVWTTWQADTADNAKSRVQQYMSHILSSQPQGKLNVRWPSASTSLPSSSVARALSDVNIDFDSDQ
jgi:hypothetical protein